MRIITPYEINDDTLVSSTIPEADYPAWVSTTNYVAGNRVTRTTTHHIYEALRPTSADVPEDSPLDWLDLGACNCWRMFDQKVGTVSSATTSITVAFEAGQMVQAVALLELTAKEAQVVVTDATDGEVYDKTVSLVAPISSPDWWTYFFEPYKTRNTATFEDLPSYGDATVTVTISGAPGETVSCGVCVIGSLHTFAQAVRYGASVGIQDYSRKESDDFGNLYVVERAYAKRASWDLTLSSFYVDTLLGTLANVRATPAVYIGGDNYDSLLVYGFFKNFDIVISYPTMSDCSIELEGLI